MFEKFADPKTATTAIAFTQTGATKTVASYEKADKEDVVICFWDDPDRILLVLKPEGVDANKRQLNAVKKWLNANYFNQALIKDKSWKSGSNGLASAETKDGSGLYVKMMKKSKVTQAKLDTGCDKVMCWLGAADTGSKPADTGSKPADTKSGSGGNNGGSKPANNGGSKPADTKSGTGNNGGSKPAATGGSKPADNGGSKPAPAPFKYDDNAGGAANLDAFLGSLGWDVGKK